MSKILYIKANPKPDNVSNTFTLANAFIDEYRNNNPEDEIITLNLYEENIRPLDSDMLVDLFSGEESPMRKYALQFAEADKYIIAAPMWNLSIPAILKAYFDYVVYVGITFKYTSEGPVGLLTDKPRKAVHITTRGGAYSGASAVQYEMGDRYIKTILGFMGVYDINTIAFELTNVLQGSELEAARQRITNEAIEAAKKF